MPEMPGGKKKVAYTKVRTGRVEPRAGLQQAVGLRNIRVRLIDERNCKVLEIMIPELNPTGRSTLQHPSQIHRRTQLQGVGDNDPRKNAYTAHRY